MSTPKTNPLRVSIKLGDVEIEYEAHVDLGLPIDATEAQRVRRVMAAAAEMGFALLGVGAHREEHRV